MPSIFDLQEDVLIKEYHKLKKNFEGLDYKNLEGFGVGWNNDLAEIGQNIKSLKLDKQEEYMDNYIHKIEDEIIQEKNIKEKNRKSLFRIYLIFFFRKEDFYEQYNELHLWYFELFKADVRSDIIGSDDDADTSHIRFGVIKGGKDEN